MLLSGNLSEQRSNLSEDGSYEQIYSCSRTRLRSIFEAAPCKTCEDFARLNTFEELFDGRPEANSAFRNEQPGFDQSLIGRAPIEHIFGDFRQPSEYFRKFESERLPYDTAFHQRSKLVNFVFLADKFKT